MKFWIRICIKVISWIRIRIRINLQMTSQNVWDMSLFEHFFMSLNLHLEARIWIRIRIRTRVEKSILALVSKFIINISEKVYLEKYAKKRPFTHYYHF
jgi:hypothetical protein